MTDPTKLLIAGDTHGNTRWAHRLSQSAAELGCDSVFQVGDFGFWFRDEFTGQISRDCEQYGITWSWIDGNHDDFDYLEEERALGADSPVELWPDIHYVPRGYSWTWSGVKFLAMGGAYSIDKSRRTAHHTWWEQELITPADVERAEAQGECDVLFCHDAPYGVNTIEEVVGVNGYKDDRTSTGNREMLRHVFDSAKPKLVMHGHFHYAYEDILQGAAVMGLARDDMRHGSSVVLDLLNLDERVERIKAKVHGRAFPR